MWEATSAKEKATFKPGVYKNTTNTTGQEDQDPTEQSGPTDLSAISGLRAQSKSMKEAESRVDRWMEEWNQKAIHIAATNHCEIVMFAVSTHLSSHNFQLGRSTPGAAEFVKQMYEADGIKNYQSRLQAFATGAKVNDINPSITQKGQPLKPVTVVKEARVKLGELVGGKKTDWSWQGCDKALGSLGYKVVFLPGIVSKPIWIKTASHSLGRSEAKLIIEDLENKLIRVVRDTNALLGRTSQPADVSLTQASAPNNGSQGAEVSTNQTLTNGPTRKRTCPTGLKSTFETRKKRCRQAPSLTASELALDQSSEESFDNAQQSSEEED
ncbi:hypothetical protein PCASD_23364 [Puccinia coronata f. sp. avenae]|uniref:Uncharacterized protein n=1 Tax=Puccinia coronata f. sp. avenae TaxID=200324 RepID=A0A2N5TJ76_9BASI|nr:hypothetical protein PCASD_23364 [Puccinia coronata f. sp. avenae]